MNHKQIVADYNIGKTKLLQSVQTRLETIGTTEAARLTGKSISYLTDLKNGRKYISYEQLIDLALFLKS